MLIEKGPLLPLDDRIAILKRYAEVLAEHKQELASTITEEMGKAIEESLEEVDAMIGKVAISIEAYQERCPEKTTHGVHITHRPLGICAVLGPFNFPGHLPNGHIVPAILAGNTIYFKPSEYTPRTGELMVSCWEKAGLPKGILNLVQGGPEMGKALAEHPKLDALFFTGSYQTGLELSKYFGHHPEKLLALEMGGNNPLVVTQVKNIAYAVEETIASAFATSGQRCSCARRLIVVNNEPFIDALKKAIPNVKTYPLVHATRIRDQAGLKGKGPIIPATLLERRLPDEEIFGPILQLIRVPTFDEALKEANNTRYGLTAALFSSNPEEWEVFRDTVRAGIINWNRRTTGASSWAPFGGIGISGNHRPSAYYAADYCAYPVSSIEISQ